jgi:hypothetical protein
MLAPPTPAGDPAVLEDTTGRRGRWMRRLGRTLSLLLVGWLVVLLVGGLGLTPVASLPFGDILRPSKGPQELVAPPKPREPSADDLRPARPASRATGASPTRAQRVSQPQPPTRVAPRRARTFTTQTPVRRRSIPAQAGGSSGRGGAAPPTTSPTVTPTPTSARGSKRSTAPGQSAGAPGQSGEAPGLSVTAAPGESGSAPGHTGTTPGRSESAPGQAKHETTTTTAALAPGPPQRP